MLRRFLPLPFVHRRVTPSPVWRPLPLIESSACLAAIASATLALSSCCSQAVKVRDPLPKVVIDAHAHVFNAFYLPIREICVSFAVRETVMEPESESPRAFAHQSARLGRLGSGLQRRA